MDIADRLLLDAKKRAAEEGTTLRAVLEEALRAWLAGPPPAGAWQFRWRTERGRLLPGVDLDDRGSLLEATGGPEEDAERGFR